MVVPVFTDRITRVGQGCDGTERLEYPSNTNRSGLNTLVIRTVGNQGNVKDCTFWLKSSLGTHFLHVPLFL